MSEEPPGPPSPRRLHPVDVVVAVALLLVAAAAWNWLFRAAPLPESVDRIVGAELTLEFPLDRDWKRNLLAPGTKVVIENRLTADVTSVGPSPERGESTLRVVLVIRGRDGQRPQALTQLRPLLRRGNRVTLRDEHPDPLDESEIEAEVVEVRPASGTK